MVSSYEGIFQWNLQKIQIKTATATAYPFPFFFPP